jgi:tetratricopeptide (TPR) repeat protein
MLLQAAEFFDAAEPAYLNAQDLMPGDVRWPYYLAHLYKSAGDIPRSMAAFSRVLELKPDDVAALVWLGRLYLDQGQADRAGPLFERARAAAPQAPAVLVGLGQAALARKDYARAAALLEEALALDPELASIHSPLAMAYRGLGDQAKSEAHLTLWRNTEVLVPDPLRLELDLALNSGLSFELRGVRALEQRDFAAAAGFFARGLEVTRENSALGRSLRHKLGTAKFLTGDVQGAMDDFERVVRRAPAAGLDAPSAKAYYSLGVIMASGGRGARAIEYFSWAVRYNPSYVEALVALGDALRRAGRPASSLEPYGEVVRLNPRSVQARLGYAMALVRLRRYREARDWLEEAARMQPDQPDLAHALARLLAAAPDDGVRDGRRALDITQELFKTQPKSTTLGETMAMTAAELGNFEEAAAIQRGVLDAARRAGLDGDVRRMTANLRLYEAGRPCRTPWPDDDPVHSPGPPVDPALLPAPTKVIDERP